MSTQTYDEGMDLASVWMELLFSSRVSLLTTTGKQTKVVPSTHSQDPCLESAAKAILPFVSEGKPIASKTAGHAHVLLHAKAAYTCACPAVFEAIGLPSEMNG
jgi:hypothetical protein